MSEYISTKVVNWLSKNNTIMQDEYEVYLFGVKQLIITLFNVVTAVIIGIIMRQLSQMFIFMISFMLLRIYAGGYHASTPVRCYILTVITIIVSLSVVKYITLFWKWVEIILLFADMIIIVLSPVGTLNKPLDGIEYTFYRKKTIVILIIENLIVLVCMKINFMKINFMKINFMKIPDAIVMAIIVVALSVLCGRNVNNQKF